MVRSLENSVRTRHDQGQMQFEMSRMHSLLSDRADEIPREHNP